MQFDRNTSFAATSCWDFPSSQKLLCFRKVLATRTLFQSARSSADEAVGQSSCFEFFAFEKTMVGRYLVLWLAWLRPSLRHLRLCVLLWLVSLLLFLGASRLWGNCSLGEGSRFWQTLFWQGSYPCLDLWWCGNLIKRRFDVLDIYFHRLLFCLSCLCFLRCSIWILVCRRWLIYATLTMSGR